MKKKENALELIGIKWEDLNFKLLEVVSEIRHTRKMQGSTYIGIARALVEYKIPADKCEVVDGVSYLVINSSLCKESIRVMEEMYKGYDNVITITVGEKDGYVTNSILVCSKNSHYFILLGYPKEKEDKVDPIQMQKRLV